MIQIVYFARVRETLGMDGELFAAERGTKIAELIDQLAGQSERHAAAFSDRSKLRFALDHTMVHADAVLNGAIELAIFPPVTGG